MGCIAGAPRIHWGCVHWRGRCSRQGTAQPSFFFSHPHTAAQETAGGGWVRVLLWFVGVKQLSHHWQFVVILISIPPVEPKDTSLQGVLHAVGPACRFRDGSLGIHP